MRISENFEKIGKIGLGVPAVEGLKFSMAQKIAKVPFGGKI